MSEKLTSKEAVQNLHQLLELANPEFWEFSGSKDAMGQLGGIALTLLATQVTDNVMEIADRNPVIAVTILLKALKLLVATGNKFYSMTDEEKAAFVKKMKDKGI